MYKWILALIGIMAAASAVTVTRAQSQKPQVRHSLKQPPAFSPAGMQASRARLKAHYAKLNAPWTGDDRPYQGIRDQIDGALATGRKPAAILAQYESAANAKPSDPQALFGWGYAAYKAATAPNGIDAFEAMQELSNVYSAVERVHFPQTYNYARLMFLRDAHNFLDLGLKTLGERLLQHDPNDFDVKYYLAGILNDSPIPAERQQALAYAQELVRLHPEKPSVYGLLAAYYQESWLKSKSKADAEKATTAYRQYLQLAPPDAEWRKQAEKMIAQMQGG